MRTTGAPHLPDGWSASLVLEAESAELRPGVRCTPRMRLEPGPGAAGHDQMVLSVLEVSAGSAAAMDALASQLVAEQAAHPGDAKHRVLRWVTVRDATPAAFTSAHFILRRPGTLGREATLIVAHVRGDMRTDETAAASVALAGTIAATMPELH